MKRNEKTTKSKMQPLDNFSFEVRRVKQFDATIFFDLQLNGVYVYGMSVVEGKNGDFISWPSRKGKDNKYYSYAYANLSDAQTKEILTAVQEELDK